MSRGGGLAVGLALFWVACGGKSTQAPPVTPPFAESGSRQEDSGADEIARLDEELAEARAALSQSLEEREQIRQTLDERGEALMVLEEANASLELELASALEELLRAQASLRNVTSRAFAVSRIAEVRVELDSARKRDDRAIESRIERADEFLARADQALAEDNVGGAAYLADRAGELLRQARTVAELRKKATHEITPIVPPRTMDVQSDANLRRGPSSKSERLGALAAGATVTAISRQGDWYQIITAASQKGWIHRTLLR